VKKLKGSPQKVRRAQMLLKADVEGPNWTDAKISEAFDCRSKTVEDVRKRLVTEGFEVTLRNVSMKVRHFFQKIKELRRPPFPKFPALAC
jgi:hypothetical protein